MKVTTREYQYLLIFYKDSMPIMYHKETGNKFFFIHIPRTAGRFLVENLGFNGCEIIHPFKDEHLSLTSPYVRFYVTRKIEGVQMLHAHKSIYNKWNKIKNIPHFTIVRNPVDRFFSASSLPDLTFNQSDIEDWNNFNKNISEEHNTNFFRPQYEFISTKTKVWKYENGFGKDFCNWLSNIVSFSFKIKSSKYYKIEEKNKFKRTEALINNIKKFYKKDNEFISAA